MSSDKQRDENKTEENKLIAERRSKLDALRGGSDGGDGGNNGRSGNAYPNDFRRNAIAALPPLIKGYLRLGGFIGDGAVIDYQFNTVDVCIVVETDRITGKYIRHYTRDERPKNGET